MRNMFFVLLLVLAFVVSCEPDQELSDNFLIAAILDGSIIDVDDSDSVKRDGIIIGIVNPFWVIRIHKLPVITCNLFGYPEICSMDGTKGRVLGKTPTGVPTKDDITTYREAESEADTGDLGGYTLYSNSHYPFDDDTSVNKEVLRGAVAAWGAGWNNARVDFCDIANGTHIFCVQE